MLGETISHYKILSEVGRGGMGVVYKATDTSLDRAVALKFLAPHLMEDQEGRARFIREAKAAAALDHPNICTVYEINQEQDQTFIAMAYLEGQTLKDKIAERPLKLDEALDIAIQTAQGLQAAHEKGIVHRDIKGANLMVTPQGQVKIMDFGLAQLAERSQLTKTTTMLGTPAYMSPEQAQRLPTDRRTDIWSLGVVIYEMVAARLPFAGERQEAVLYAIGAEDPEPITALRAGLPMELEWIVGKAMAKDAGERYQHVEEMIVDLRSVQGKVKSGSATSALKDQAPQASTRHLFRSYAPWAAACILALMWALKEPTWKDGPVARFSGPIQFEIRLPEQARFVPAYIGGGVAVSPDGSKLVALGRRRDSSEILFVRELDSAEAWPLEGTNNARFPFWSPDGKQLGFAADSELKTVDLERGITRSLAEAPRFRGGAWSDWQGGTILFTDNTGPLYRIPAQGGDPQPASRLGPGESSHRWPVFFDEGRFLFASPQEGRRRGAIFAADLAEEPSSSHQFVLEADSAAQYTAADQGYLLFLQDQTLLAQPFDARRAATGSGPVPIAQKVDTGLYRSLRASFSVSLSGVLAYRRSTGLFGVSELVWFDRQGKRLGALGPPDLYAFVRLSPDEKTAALTIIPEGGGADIWTLDVVRGVLTQRTFHPDHLDRVPIWSPDSQRLLISSTKEDRGTIFVLEAHGSEEPSPFFAVELDRQVSDWPTHWVGPEGPVLFSRLGAEGHDIWEYAPARSPQTRPLIEGTGHQLNARVSPNGNLVAYASDELGDNEIFLQPYSKKGQKIRISTAGGNYPHWRGDGRELFYVSLGGALMSVRVSAGGNPTVTQPEKLFQTRTPFGPAPMAYKYSVTRDGQRFLVVTQSETSPATVVLNWQGGLGR